MYYGQWSKNSRPAISGSDETTEKLSRPNFPVEESDLVFHFDASRASQCGVGLDITQDVYPVKGNPIVKNTAGSPANNAQITVNAYGKKGWNVTGQSSYFIEMDSHSNYTSENWLCMILWSSATDSVNNHTIARVSKELPSALNEPVGFEIERRQATIAQSLTGKRVQTPNDLVDTQTDITAHDPVHHTIAHSNYYLSQISPDTLDLGVMVNFGGEYGLQSSDNNNVDNFPYSSENIFTGLSNVNLELGSIENNAAEATDHYIHEIMWFTQSVNPAAAVGIAYLSDYFANKWMNL